MVIEMVLDRQLIPVSGHVRGPDWLRSIAERRYRCSPTGLLVLRSSAYGSLVSSPVQAYYDSKLNQQSRLMVEIE